MTPFAQVRSAAKQRWQLRVLLYEDEYIWFAVLSVLNVVLNWMVIRGGPVFHPEIDAFIRDAGLGALLLYQLLLVALVVVICEDVGRLRPTTGRRIASLACVVTALPVAIAAVGLMMR